MSNNYSQSQNNQNGPAGPGNQPRKSGLLSNYTNQQAAPANNPAPQGPPPMSPFPGAPGQGRQPGPYMGQSSPQLPPGQPQWNGPSFMARPMQMVQRLSAKMSAMRRPNQPPVDPNPLVRYHGQQQPMLPGAAPVATKPTPWRRSRIQQIIHLRKKRLERWRRTGPGSKRLIAIISSVIAGLLLVSLLVGGLTSYNYYQSQLPQLQGLANLQLEQSTRFYDRNGQLIYTLYDTNIGRSTPLSYNQIPGYLQDAQVAIEDKTFWSNDGIDVNAIIRSAFIDANAGAAQTGASTLTQQVIKNLINNEPANRALTLKGQIDRSPQRKLSEAALSIALTQQYPKWKIMEMYFNISAYGAQEQGVEAAAQDLFGLQPKCNANFKCQPAVTFLDRDISDMSKCKDPNDETTCPIDPVLGLARASLLVGIPQNPVIFDPTVHPEFYDMLLARQDLVLHQMESMQSGDLLHGGAPRINLGLGSNEDYAQANHQDIIINDQVVQQVEALSKTFKFNTFQDYKKAPHFIQWIIKNLSIALGSTQDIDPDTGISVSGYQTLLTGGFNVRTTLDLNLETYVESAVHRHLDVPEYQKFQGITVALNKHNNVNDGAVVVMDNKTGEVLAMDGSANFNDKSPQVSGQINMAISPRQPGSSFKPLVMAAAFEKGWYPGIVLPDFQTYFPTGSSPSAPVSPTTTYMPHDYGNTYHKLNSNIALAIANSFNIPAIKAEMYVGVPGVYAMAQRLGITTIDPSKTSLGPSMALGTYDVPLLQMVGAYQTFANQGARVPPQGILDVWDNYGHQLYHFDPSKPRGVQVLSPQVSYLVTSILDNEPLRSLEFGGDHDLSMFDWRLPDGTHPDVAAKTGTTDNFNDNWTIGYTPDITVGVWTGNADDSPMINSIGVTGAAPIWHSVIEYASGKCNTATDQIPCPPLDLSFTDRHFSMPSGVIQQQVNIDNGLQGSGYTSYMLVNEAPQQAGKPACDPTVIDPTAPNYCPPNGQGNGNGNGNGG